MLFIVFLSTLSNILKTGTESNVVVTSKLEDFFKANIEEVELGYFADVKNRYGQSNLDMLSPTARKCYEQLVDGTDMNRTAALKLVLRRVMIGNSFARS